ncbi:MAG TPA: phosphate regulon sensor histidine kinase PhoR [Nitrospiria bacterium]
MKTSLQKKVFLAFVFFYFASALLLVTFSPTPLPSGGVLLLIGGIGLAAAWGLSVFFTRNLGGSLEEIRAAAAEWAEGNLERKAMVPSPGQAADLGVVLNRMVASLGDQFREVKDAHGRLAAILSSMTEGVLVLDRGGAIILINSALEEMFHLKEAKVRGRSYPEVLRHHSLAELIKTVLDTRSGQTKEILIQTPRERNYQIQASVTEGGYAVFVFHDITPLKHLERVRKDFVANVSHEIRTPLTSIMGYIEALQDGAKDDPEKSQEFFEIIRKHTGHLNAILSDLLELSSIESGEYLWKKEPVSLSEVVEQAVRLVRPASEKKGQSVDSGSVDAGLRVSGDKSKLIEVFSNLLDNAVKYTPEGGKISVEVREENGRIEAEVVDSGIGIPKKSLPRLFERFYRVDTARSREMGGTGLGLAIVKHIVEAHGGRVSVESSPGNGSRFRVSLLEES